MVWVIDNIVTLVQQFTAVATADPISAVLVTIGGLLTAFSALYFGYLSFRGILNVVTPDVGGGGPPQAGH